MTRTPAIREPRMRARARGPSRAPRTDRSAIHSGDGSRQNVARLERLLSVVGGVALAVHGIRRRGLGGTALAVFGGALVHRGFTGRCAVYRALDVSTRPEAPWLLKQHGGSAVLEASEAVRVEDTITIAAPASALYRYWRAPGNLLEVLRHLHGGGSALREGSRSRTDGDEAEEPAEDLVIEMINDIPNRLVAWKTVAGAAMPSAGSVHFDPGAGGRGTEMRIGLEYLPPGGPFGALLLRLVHGDPAPRLRRDLSRLRALMERRHPRSAGDPRSR